jgi:ABC-2 type transport system ATP-binding protein
MSAISSAPIPSAFETPTRSGATALEADALSFAYGDRQALRGVSFSIARGEIFGFLGPNGSGKSTLFRVLSTLIPPQSGAARMLGMELRANSRELRRRLGVVFQRPSLDGKLTVAENLAHHGRLYGMSGVMIRDRSAAMLKQLGLADRAGDLVETLSGGQQRRAELAKSLLHEPELLLLDEPSTGLDPAARREFFDHLAHLRASRHVTIVLTTHFMEEAERCDRIAVLHQGGLAAIAPPGELKQQVGGDVVVIRSTNPEALAAKIAQRMHLQAVLIGGALRIERPRAHELVAQLVDAFGIEIDSITFGKPTLEDVFVHLTGDQFVADGVERAQ